MSEASASITAPLPSNCPEEMLPRFENPGRAFANGIMLALPLWGLIGLAIWAIV